VSQGFTKEQLKVAQAPACGDTQKEAGRKAGVSRSSVIRWMKLPYFRQKVKELTEQYHTTQDETFIEAARESVEAAVTPQELVGYFSSILRNDDVRISDRLKAGQCLGKWMGLEDGALKQVEVPELPLEAFAEDELCQRLDLLKSQAVVAAQFLMQQAVNKAACGETQEAVMVMYRALDLADQCIDDLPQAANVLSKKGFGILSKLEYLNLKPPENSPENPIFPAFDRAFSWTYFKHQKRR